jgi:hypothetical protein
MLTKTYQVDRQGRWQRRLGDFTEDVVLVCSGCGAEPQGRFEVADGRFAFVPLDGANSSENGGADSCISS